MKIDITNLNINESEILRYLGYSGQHLSETFKNKILEIKEESKKLFKPKYIYNSYNLNHKNNCISLSGTNLILKGNDIRQLLTSCNECILLAATLGNDIERRIRYYEKFDLTKAVILDACATTAIEEICDLIETHLKTYYSKNNKSLTYRYSPGYGDLPLEIQKSFINTLDCARKIGLNVSKHMLLIPRKSVTCIIGISNSDSFENKKFKCSNCNNNLKCIYRRKDDNYECSRIS